MFMDALDLWGDWSCRSQGLETLKFMFYGQ